ncbi:MAG TPA: glycogen debranching N-terminal domain-containing protein [Nitrolancea sp.]|jgi:glycogen debranching enzyme|nr:glycogen debranching N-terminal domain-containing protein [Nitrolancea sp.]
MSVQDLAAVAGTSFIVSDAFGNINPASQHGIFAADTRFLSRFQLELSDIDVTLLRSGPAGFSESHIYLTNHATEQIPANDIEIVRRRILHRIELIETIELTNRGMERLKLSVLLNFSADFADIFEVRSVARLRPGSHSRCETDGDSIVFHDTIGKEVRTTRISFSQAPESSDDGRVLFDVSLEPQEQWTLDINIGWTVPRLETARPVPLMEDSSDPSVMKWMQEAPKIVTEDPDLERAYERSIRDLGALEIALNSGYPIPAAGLPWYLAIFGRDSTITSLQTLMLNPRHAHGTLRTLAAYQSVHDDAFRDAEPGKIAHEIRFGELAVSGEEPHATYYGSVDATPLWLILYGAYFRWSGDRKLVDDLLPTAERALEWIDRYGDLDGDGLVEYRRRSVRGLENQGWKDSWDSVRFADGRLASVPIALVEVQGYVYAARLAMASIYDAVGRPDDATRQRDQASTLKALVQDRYWMPDRGYFAMALDGEKRQVDGITSNPGHLLWCGLPDHDKAEQVAQRLMEPDMFSGWGIRTMASSMTAYSPISYHNGSVWPHDNGLIAAGLQRYGLFEESTRVINGMLDTTRWFGFHRLPELFCGYSRNRMPFPVDYPVACSPQAWASGSVVQMVQTLLGIGAGADGIESHPMSGRVGKLNGVWFKGERFDVTSEVTIAPRDGTATSKDTA